MLDEVPLVVRSKRGSYAGPDESSTEAGGGNTAFLVEWRIEKHKRLGPFTLELELFVEATWGDESLSWRVTKDSEQVFRIDPTRNKSLRRNRLLLASISNEDLLHRCEDSLKCSGDQDPQSLLRLLEASRWTFARENTYNESFGPKIKEGLLSKAPGGYESYNRSRWRVLSAQIVTISVSIALWVTSGHYLALYIGFAIISLLSLLHWGYYRLNAIDATCVIPCLFFPPVGPILVIVWTVFGFLFPRGDERWFVLRQAHLEFYEAWDSPRREPVGVLLLDRNSRVKPSSLFPSQLIVTTPYRSLRLWASSRRERNDWVVKIDACIVDQIGLHGDDEGVASSFAPLRRNVPVKALVDARETYGEMLKAIQSAKKEIFIAGWMISPELYLARDSDWSGLALPVKNDSSSVFQNRLPTRIYPGSRHVYDLLDSTEAVELTSYDFILAGEMSQRPRSARWILRGLCQRTGEWVELARESHVNLQLIGDAMEPIRFRGVKRGLKCTAFEFRFPWGDDAEDDDDYAGDNGKDGQQLEESWIDVGPSDAIPSDSTRAVKVSSSSSFTCGGIRLYYAEKDISAANVAQLLDPKGRGEDARSDSMMDRFFRLMARTDQETQLDRLYRILTGRSTTASAMSKGSANRVSSDNGSDSYADEDLLESQPSPTNILENLHRLQSSSSSTPFALAANSTSSSQRSSSSSALLSSSLEQLNARLDRVIAKKVLEDGVKVYILVYRDVDLFLPNASASAKRKLLHSALWNRNIQVIRHAPEGRTYGSIQHFFTCFFSRGKTWWSHHEKLLCVDQTTAFVGGLDLALGRFDDDRHALWDRAKRVWKGQDYYNPHFKDFAGLAHAPFVDSVARSEVPRMPWHDVQCRVGGDAARDVARHFIGRWNAEKRELKPGNDRFSILLPRYPPSDLGSDDVHRDDEDIILDTDKSIPDMTICDSCQVLRSVAPWSSPSDTEHSILDAYLSLIASAEKYVYIEQQFFSSGLAGKPVRNPIVRALADRVCRAVRVSESSDFKVVVLLPVLPAFEGAIADNGSARSVLHWNLRTIRKMWEYIDKKLSSSSPGSIDDDDQKKAKAREILGFYAVRKVELDPERYPLEARTEQIYIHSKLIMVDDQSAIIGSANLNDRSMLGTRDSEVAVLFKSDSLVKSLRTRLVREHAGGDIGTWRDWDDIADSNTTIVERLFPDVPRNAFSSLEHLDQLSRRCRQPSLMVSEEVARLVSDLKGHVVRFPTEFLSKEPALLPRAVRGDRESVLPLENFT